MIEFVTYTDKWHTDLNDFRNNVCIENGAKDANSEKSHSELMAEFNNSDEAEEIYKYSNAKWRQVEFASIEGLKYNNQLVAISGSQHHANSLRILMHRYTLHAFRKTLPEFTWHTGGFIDRHYTDACNKNKQSIFFTIYPHNKTLAMFAHYLKQKKTNSNKPMLGKFDFLPDSVKFKGVNQYVFYHLIDKSSVFTEEILQYEGN